MRVKIKRLTLLDSSLLVVGVIAELHHLLQESIETESKVIHVLTWLEGQVLPLLAKSLQGGLAGAVAAYAGCSDGVPSLLGSPLVGKRELHFGRDCSDEGGQRASILMVVDVAMLDRLPHVPHLEPDPHDRGPLDVVGFGEGRPPRTGTNFPDHSPDPVEAVVLVVPAAAAAAVHASSGRASAMRASVLSCPL